jgi:hypothetical protein
VPNGDRLGQFVKRYDLANQLVRLVDRILLSHVD